MKNKNEETTIVQQSYNSRSTMKNLWNTRTKHDNETQQWNTTYKHRNDSQQWKTTSVQELNQNEKQEWENNNRTTIIQQSFKNEKPFKNTRIKHDNETTMKNNI